MCCFRKLMKGALGVRHNLSTTGQCLSPLGKQRPLEKTSWRVMGFKPDLKEPIGFGPEDSKEGKHFYDHSWGDPSLIFTAIHYLCDLFLTYCKLSL